MDPFELAQRAVSHLPDYLDHAGGTVARQMGADLDRALVSSLQRFYQWLKQAVSGDRAAKKALQQFEQKPDDKRRQTTLQEVLARLIEADPSSAAPLVEHFVNEAERVRAEVTVNRTENARVAISGRTINQPGAVIIGSIGHDRDDEDE